ncbi:MAG: hypothetical protein INH37_15840, partial [Myxococcaceae bacterium]|nr:hypothetical protein [Myxococcaceae bacterium]
LAASVAGAQVNECAEAFLECKEDCALEFSSVRQEVQKQLGRCLKKCGKKRATCEERELETRANGLDPGALDRSPAATDVDENGMPNRTSGASPRADEPRAPPPSDQAPTVEPAPVGRKPADDAAARTRPADEPAPEVPASSRTALKGDDRSPPVAAQKVPPPAAGEPNPAAPARSPEPLVLTATPDTQKKLDEDVRDDAEAARRAEPPAPAPTKKKKNEGLPPPPAKPKEEDHDDLRNY